MSRLLRWFLRLPEHPGKQRIIRSWLSRVLPREGVVLEVQGGVKLILHPSDWIGYLLMTTGSYEPRTLEFIARNLTAGASAIFAGVNFGLHLVVAAKAVGATGCVIGVEPQPSSASRALLNLSLNEIGSQARIALLALDETPGFVSYGLPPPDNSGAASLLDGSAPRLITAAVRFDDLAKMASGPIRLFLVDVEGYEGKALRGLGANRPEIIIVEFSQTNQRKAGYSCGALADLLTQMGYELRDLHGNPVTDPATELYESNVIAYRPGAAPVWVA